MLDDNGPLTCSISNIEVMGRDVSIVSTHPASQNPVVRSIISSDIVVNASAGEVRYSLKPHKVFIFDKETEQRLVDENVHESKTAGEQR